MFVSLLGGIVARIVVEVPEKVAALLGKEPLLRLAITEAIRREVESIFLLYWPWTGLSRNRA